MTLQELANAVLLKATGKATVLTPTDTKYQKILGIANAYQDSWQNEFGVDWNSLYQKDFELGTISTTDTYELDDEIRKISDTRGDFVQLFMGDNHVNYEIVAADTLKRYSDGAHVCAQIGRTLVFPSAFKEDSPLIGATIKAPVYVSVEPLVNPTDDVAVDIPRWLVVISAAEYVRNDITKQNQYPNLIAEADSLMDRMIDDNDAQVATVYIPGMTSSRTW
ncbi:MAG: hypothetical protein EON54_01325 [Alcaligenaceae bacterium]|nr:MAG: hypothetical protein EON54_01325 [Alcaligenaceae bacterium]